MIRFMTIVCSVVLVGLVALPCQTSAARITETSAAIGEGCDASGNNSTAMGYYTTANGESSTAMGSHSTASSYYSTAMGYNSQAISPHSIAIGCRTKASADFSTVIGEGYDGGYYLENNVKSSFMVGYMNSTGDTTPEFFVKDGAVGINNASPQTAFHVQRSVSDYADLQHHVAAIENTHLYGTSPDVLMLKVNNSEKPGTACNFITFNAKNDVIVGQIQGNGGGGIELISTSSDFAEYLPKADSDEALAPGDIVGLFPEGISKRTLNAQWIMVVTTAPLVVGNQPKEKDKSRYAPIAFLGQVPVHIQGQVHSGDYIIPSGNGDGTGVAVSPTEIKPFQYSLIVGRALESSTEQRLKTVRVLVGLPHNDLYNGLLKEKDARITQLEERLAALEAKTEKSVDAGLLPGVGIIMGSLGLFWVDRRRRRS